MVREGLDEGHDACAPDGRMPLVPEDPENLGAVYEELRRAARRLMRARAWDERSLDPTGLVNEAVIRLLRSPNLKGKTDRGYLYGAAVRTMRRILVDRARARQRLKRGGGWKRLPLDGYLDELEARNIDVVELDEALERLARWDERQAEIVSMRYLLRMKVSEIADHHGMSTTTVNNDLALARAWLRRELVGPNGQGLGPGDVA